jgi:hypothetical protein
VPELYDNDSFDVLALTFTLVKILYLHNALKLLPSLIRVIEATRRYLSRAHSPTVMFKPLLSWWSSAGRRSPSFTELPSVMSMPTTAASPSC